MARENQRLLFSLAHPDDESFGFAGTLAHYAQSGAEVHLICATNGDVGTVADEFMQGYETIADLRLAELACAASVLGLQVHTFGFRDSGMAGSPDNDHPDSLVSQEVDEIAGLVTRVIREVRPQVVVTFDPIGGYGHPDHIAIHDATLVAFDAAGDATRYPEQLASGLKPYQPQKLYYGTFSRKLMRFLLNFAPLFGIDPTRMGRNNDMNYRQIVQNEWPIHARINVDAYQTVVEQAMQCHASQMDFGDGGGLWFALRKLARRGDTFTRVQPSANGRLRERDLFEGVVLEESSA